MTEGKPLEMEEDFSKLKEFLGENEGQVVPAALRPSVTTTLWVSKLGVLLTVDTDGNVSDVQT